MNIGIPRETRVGEQRAALTPAGAKALVQEGHRVWIERGAGSRAGFEDATYQAAGATIAYTRAWSWPRRSSRLGSVRA